MEQTQQNTSNLEKKSKPRHYYKKRLIFLILIAIITYFLTKYAVEQFNIHNARKQIAAHNLNNIQTKIYDLKSEKKEEVKTLSEKAPEDSNPSIEKQIAQLNKKYNDLKLQLVKSQNQDKINKLIIAFVDLKNQIDSRENYQNSLQKFEILSAKNDFLLNKIAKLKFILKNGVKSKKQIQKSFKSLIPEIIAHKSYLKQDPGFIGKLKYGFSKLVTIRRTDGVVTKSSENVDFIITQTEKLIEKEEYGQALKLLNSLDKSYRPIMVKLIFDLKNANQLNQVSTRIFSYLKNLSN